MSQKKRTTVMPTSIDEVELKGEGGLRRAFLTRTILSIVLMGLIFVCTSIVIYSHALQKEIRKDLSNISHMILTYYDELHPGDYNLLLDEANSVAYLQKGDEIISDDTLFIDEVARETSSQITIFFYDTRMITTITDSDGARVTNTIANNKIAQDVLIRGQESFFNDIQIEKVRYCAQYTPIYASGGTCVGMIGIGRPYSESIGYVYNLSVVYAAIIVLASILAAVWMTAYTSQLVKHLDKLKDFLGAMAKGRLDGDLDQSLLNRADEVGDMGRCSLYVRGALKKLVEKDPLTNLNNRRSGNIKIEQIRRNASKYGQIYSIAIGDIDFFKKVNDTYGHDAGDAVLKEVARILSDRMTGHGTVIRWGGEEFLFVFEDSRMEDAREMLWSILYDIRQTSVDYGGKNIQFTMSYGVVQGNPDVPADTEITAADELLYYAKEHGRNRVCYEASDEGCLPSGAPADSASAESAAKTVATDQQETKPADAKDEYWDIYDVNKELTGRTMKRNDFTMKDGDYHLTVLGAVANRQGEFLVTRRVMSKSWAPGWWEISGGGVMAGETSEEAVKREIREETGLDVSGADGGYMFTYRRDNPDEGDNYFVDVYRFIMDFEDEDITIQAAEADGYMLASAQDIEELGADKVFLHYDSIKEVFNL